MPLGCSESHERERRLFFSVNEGNWIALNLQEFHFQYIKKIPGIFIITPAGQKRLLTTKNFSFL